MSALLAFSKDYAKARLEKEPPDPPVSATILSLIKKDDFDPRMFNDKYQNKSTYTEKVEKYISFHFSKLYIEIIFSQIRVN